MEERDGFAEDGEDLSYWEWMKGYVMTNLPAPPAVSAPQVIVVETSGRGIGIASIVIGAIGILMLPIVFSPIALTLGIVAVAKSYKPAWVGVVLGGAGVAYVAYAFVQLSNALSSL